MKDEELGNSWQQVALLMEMDLPVPEGGDEGEGGAAKEEEAAGGEVRSLDEISCGYGRATWQLSNCKLMHCYILTATPCLAVSC